MIRIAICDYERETVKKIENTVHDYQYKLRSQFEIHTFLDSRDLISCHCKFDLIFLDIEMPDIDGIKAAKKIREKDKKVKLVYAADHSEYAVNAFTVHPFDFAVKPLDPPKIRAILDEYIKYTVQQDEEKKVTLKTSGGTIVFSLGDIIAFEYIDNRRILVHTTSKSEEIRGSISEILQTINCEYFVSPHRSFIVNLREVNKIDDYIIYMSNGLQIPAAQKRLKEFQNMLNSYISDN
ncbi:MAG: LytTR family DNA-binding domain-containing protein [Oscillospiraceae bacterium]|nr:LytTR family DNA-binding domain-containing protein [Oscillospiraceae bacterium]